MKLGSLCTGYGGLDMAVEAHFGAELVWVSEVDKDCSTLLAARFPGVPNLGDLTKVDWGGGGTGGHLVCGVSVSAVQPCGEAVGWRR